MVLSLFDQVFLSAFNFTLNLILISIWAASLFGMYVIIIAVSMIWSSVQTALIEAPLATLRPQAKDLNDERQLLASLWMATCTLTATAFVLTWLGFTLIFGDQYSILPFATSLFVAGGLLREYVRSLLFSKFCVAQVLVLDAVYIFVAAAGLGMLWAWHGPLELTQLIVVLAFAAIFASMISILALLPLFSLQFGHAARDRYVSIWRAYSRWALLGAVLSEVRTRAHVFVIGAWFGTAAVGILEAGRLIYRPLVLIHQAWARVAQPTFARFAAVGDFGGSNLLARFSAAGAIVLAVLFIIAVWLGWPYLQSHVFRGEYTNIGTIVALWGLVSVIFLVDGVYSTQLQGLARFRELSLTSIVGALVTLVMLAVVVAMGNYEWSIGAIALGNIVELALVLFILSRVYQAGEANGWSRVGVN